MPVSVRPVPQPKTSLATIQQLKLDSAREPLLYDDVHPELCPRLVEIILGHMAAAKGRGVGSLNVGGWKSPETFFSWPEDEVRELERALINTLGARPVGWAMVNGLGAVHRRHQHRIAVLSGIYYLDRSRTVTIFELPNKTKLEVEPAPGRLVVFPGDMFHSVPVVTDKQRVSIAFDVRR